MDCEKKQAMYEIACDNYEWIYIFILRINFDKDSTTILKRVKIYAKLLDFARVFEIMRLCVNGLSRKKYPYGFAASLSLNDHPKNLQALDIEFYTVNLGKKYCGDLGDGTNDEDMFDLCEFHDYCTYERDGNCDFGVRGHESWVSPLAIDKKYYTAYVQCTDYYQLVSDHMRIFKIYDNIIECLLDSEYIDTIDESERNLVDKMIESWKIKKITKFLPKTTKPNKPPKYVMLDSNAHKQLLNDLSIVNLPIELHNIIYKKLLRKK